MKTWKQALGYLRSVGYTYAAIAKEIGANPASVSRWEKGTNEPRLKAQKALVRMDMTVGQRRRAAIWSKSPRLDSWERAIKYLIKRGWTKLKIGKVVGASEKAVGRWHKAARKKAGGSVPSPPFRPRLVRLAEKEAAREAREDGPPIYA